MLRESGQLSFNQIGQLLGPRDHSTIMHAYGKTRSVLNNDDELRAALAELESVVNGSQ
jgi:chromosomal replication initiation ATPase DnaA